MIKVSLSNHALEIKEWASVEKLNEFLNSHSTTLLFGKDVLDPKEFYSIKIWLDYSLTLSDNGAKSNSLCIGIICDQNSHSPNVLIIPEKNYFLLGFNDEVVGILPDKIEVICNLRLDKLPFNSFYYVSQLKTILIFYELGVVAIDIDGKELWNYSKDILSNVKIIEEVLHLKFLDSPSVFLNLEDGKILGQENKLGER